MRFFLFCSCYKIDNNLFRNCISLELTVGYIFLDFFPFISPQKEMFPKEENLLISYIAHGNTDELDYFDQVECHSVYQLEKKKRLFESGLSLRKYREGIFRYSCHFPGL